ncbi:MAG: hypothetical protein KKC05_01420 [Nanoarchaeota archaeon]|nr:hypothetical protein [Nanoarchaeota archaeon]
MVSTKCPICTGKRPFCIHKSYPLPKDFNIEERIKENLSKEFFGPSYSVFVGHYGYPSVNIGPLAGLEYNKQMDDPSQWFGKSYDEIILLRSLLIRSQQKENIFSKSRFVLDNQELALAKQPTDTEIMYKKNPVYHFTLSDSIQPMGPAGSIEKMRVTENVKIARHVDKVVSDDLKAADAAMLLYKKQGDVYKITTILSSGALGMEENKKLVPTRWSITATDDIVTKGMLEKVRSYPQINDYLVYESNYLGNYFTILFMPGNWEFENFEVWAPGSNWHKQTAARIIGEYEHHGGRTTYATSQAGGYYAARIASVEALATMKRQACVVSFREVSDEYSIPMGVWVVRETARRALQNMKRFNTKQEAMNYIKTKLRVPLEEYMKKSQILKQRRLTDF